MSLKGILNEVETNALSNYAIYLTDDELRYTVKCKNLVL